MYRIAVLCSLGETIAYDWSNIKDVVEKKFKEKDRYSVDLYFQENFDKCFAEMKAGSYHGVVFATNVSNEEHARRALLEEKESVKRFVNSGGGVLILHQHHLALEGKAFDILCPSLFDEKDSKSKKGNSDNSSSVPFSVMRGTLARDPSICINDFNVREDLLLMSYPHKTDISNYLNRVKNNEFAVSFVPSLITEYDYQHFESIISFSKDTKRGVTEKGHLLICSPDVRKRVIVTTILADHQEHHELLENMISYIARGEPNAIMPECTTSSDCGSGTVCMTESYLREANVHYCIECETSTSDIRKHAAYVLACNKAILVKELSRDDNDTLPIKTCASHLIDIQGNEGEVTSLARRYESSIIDLPKVSVIQKWAHLGWEWLKYRFVSRKWDSLYTTKQVSLLVHEISATCPEYIKLQLAEYFNKHRQVTESGEYSFDGLDRATEAVITICESLDIEIADLPNRSRIESCLEANEIPNGEKDTQRETLFDLADYVLSTDNIDKDTKNEIVARLVTSRDGRWACWESDSLITAMVLRALLKLEREASDDETYLQKINLICSCYDDEERLVLSEALSESVSRARDNEYQIREEKKVLAEQNAELDQKVNEQYEKIVDLKSRNNELNLSSYELEELRRGVTQRKIIMGILATIILFLVVQFILFILAMVSVVGTTPEQNALFWGAVAGHFREMGMYVLTIGSMTVTVLAIYTIGRKRFKENASDSSAGDH